MAAGGLPLPASSLSSSVQTGHEPTDLPEAKNDIPACSADDWALPPLLSRRRLRAMAHAEPTVSVVRDVRSDGGEGAASTSWSIHVCAPPFSFGSALAAAQLGLSPASALSVILLAETRDAAAPAAVRVRQPAPAASARAATPRRRAGALSGAHRAGCHNSGAADVAAGCGAAPGRGAVPMACPAVSKVLSVSCEQEGFAVDDACIALHFFEAIVRGAADGQADGPDGSGCAGFRPLPRAAGACDADSAAAKNCERPPVGRHVITTQVVRRRARDQRRLV